MRCPGSPSARAMTIGYIAHFCRRRTPLLADLCMGTPSTRARRRLSRVHLPRTRTVKHKTLWSESRELGGFRWAVTFTNKTGVGLPCGGSAKAFLVRVTARNTVEFVQRDSRGGGKSHIDQRKPIVTCKWGQCNGIAVVVSRVPSVCSFCSTILLLFLRRSPSVSLYQNKRWSLLGSRLTVPSNSGQFTPLPCPGLDTSARA